MTRKIACALVVLAVALAGRPTGARALDHPLGVRAGYTSWGSINQFHFGIHSDWGELAPDIALVPGVEVGLGDDFTVVTFNGDLIYRSAELVSRPWEMYGGGSLSFNVVDGPVGGTGTDLGLSGLLGLSRQLDNGHTALGEIRLGLVDSPDFKLTLGYSLF